MLVRVGVMMSVVPVDVGLNIGDETVRKLHCMWLERSDAPIGARVFGLYRQGLTCVNCSCRSLAV